MIENLAATILVVDDDPLLRDIISRWLTEEGYRFETAANGKEALAALRDGSYELLIADIEMPEMTGLELLAAARDEFQDLAVLMATGVDDRETAIRCLMLGAYGYVTKPLDADEMLINVVNALQRRRLTLESKTYQERLEREVRERTADLRQREEEISLRLVAAGEYRDRETGAHIRRIGVFAEILARALGWDPSAVEELRLAAPMHDVGKIGIPDKVLLKPGRLNEDEFEVIKEHTLIGNDLLAGSGIPVLRLAQEIALTHQEKWDGSGYPNGLKGEEIPESGRLVAIIDVYDALVHDRVYRAALSEEEALAIMTEARGKHFDPRMFDVFLEVLPELRRGEEGMHDQLEASRRRTSADAVEASLEAPRH